jgi:hypothetical protein
VFGSAMNKIMFLLLNAENVAIKWGLKEPFGLTLYAIFRKE